MIMNKKATKEMRDQDIKVHAWDIIRMIPDELLAKIAEKTKVDYCAKVLSGERMFYLLLSCILKFEDISQRILCNEFNSDPFKLLFNISKEAKIVHSSISARLATIDLGFFQKAFELMYTKLSSLYTEAEIRSKCLIRVDSSMVAETCNKLKSGMTVGRKKDDPAKSHRRQIKYTMGFDGFGVQCAKAFTDQSCLSEDVAMPEVLNDLIKKDKEHKNLYVLDRGFSSLDNYVAVSEKGARFVGRIKTNRKMDVVESLMHDDTDRDLGKLTLIGDDVVRLYHNRGKEPDQEKFRVVKAKFKTPRDTTRKNSAGYAKRVENEIFFITNDFELTPQEIAEAYRRRWDIEVFYRFIKQNMCFSHFISTNENGIQVVMYMTLIATMLIMIYKRENENLYNGERAFFYSNAKYAFKIEIDEWITKLAILISGGNPGEGFRSVVVRTRIP